ncbi:MAG TPA: tail fiber domain-containing protein [candidate division Zixibacteria bacterium]|jgi:hypothetical protein
MKHTVRFVSYAVLVSMAILVATTGVVEAAVPSLINYQGILKDGDGDPQTGTFSVTFRIYPTPAGGLPVWEETQNITSDALGLFNVLLGTSVALDESIFSASDRWLGIDVEGDGEMIPRIRFVTVPYAHRVATVDGSTGGAITGDVSIASNLDVDGEIRATAKATIGSGHANTGSGAFVAGGNNNARGDYSVISGGGGGTPSDSNSAHGQYTAVGGGQRNIAGNNHATVGGGFGNVASGELAVISGGRVNKADGTIATVGGGTFNAAIGNYSTIGGGESDTASGQWSTIGGGMHNRARGDYSTVGGGGGFTATDSNSASGGYSTIGGGRSNLSIGSSATVSGGNGNRAVGQYASVGGGWNNQAIAIASVVAGGSHCVNEGELSVIGGGDQNDIDPGVTGATIAGGFGNQIDAGADAAAIGGGSNHIYANARYSTVPGGDGNLIRAPHSLAAGRNTEVLASHGGTFLWADSLNCFFQSIASNEFAARATGGVRFVTGVSGCTPSTGVQVASGGGSWSSLSDRNLKADIESVDVASILEKVAAMPMSTWRYISQDAEIRHIGPMAQDFYAAFEVGEDDRHITSVDADGVALASIQALYALNQELRRQLESQRAEIERLKEQQKRIEALEARLADGHEVSSMGDTR